MSPDLFQAAIVAILSGGLVSGIFTLLSKRSRSPESQNELARLGNEFAAQLLEDARTERKELRLTIADLEKSNDTKQQSIDRLKALAEEKDRRIEALEQRQQVLAEKLQRGEQITLADIFGGEAPRIRIAINEGAP